MSGATKFIYQGFGPHIQLYTATNTFHTVFRVNSITLIKLYILRTPTQNIMGHTQRIPRRITRNLRVKTHKLVFSVLLDLELCTLCSIETRSEQSSTLDSAKNGIKKLEPGASDLVLDFQASVKR